MNSLRQILCNVTTARPPPPLLNRVKITNRKEKEIKNLQQVISPFPLLYLLKGLRQGQELGELLKFHIKVNLGHFYLKTLIKFEIKTNINHLKTSGPCNSNNLRKYYFTIEQKEKIVKIYPPRKSLCNPCI